MGDIEMKLKDICCLEDRLVEICKSEVCLAKPDFCGMGEVVDMVKDLAEAEEKHWKAEYYKSIVKAMEKEEEDERYGYNPNRTASGRYASTGYGNRTRGGRMGFNPDDIMMLNEPYVHMLPRQIQNVNDHFMGYDGNNSNNSSSTGGMSSQSSSSGNNGGRYGYTPYNNSNPDFDPRYGEAYNRYKIAKRHYHDTNNTSDKEEMDTHAKEHMMDLMSSAEEIYTSSNNPELKKKIKDDLTKLVNKLPV